MGGLAPNSKCSRPIGRCGGRGGADGCYGTIGTWAGCTSGEGAEGAKGVDAEGAVPEPNGKDNAGRADGFAGVAMAEEGGERHL